MCDSIERLHAAIRRAADGDPRLDRTAKLMQGGIPKMAKKLAEEAVEVGLEAVQGERRAVVAASVDCIYHLTALWARLGVEPHEIWAEMARRERLYGIAGKAPKGGAGDCALPSVALPRRR